jgi:hypothetical protein
MFQASNCKKGASREGISSRSGVTERVTDCRGREVNGRDKGHWLLDPSDCSPGRTRVAVGQWARRVGRVISPISIRRFTVPQTPSVNRDLNRSPDSSAGKAPLGTAELRR